MESLILGGVDLGKVRVCVGKTHPKFQDYIILGMNVLMWHDIVIANAKRKIFLQERKFQNLKFEDKYSHSNPASLNLVAANEITEQVTHG